MIPYFRGRLGRWLILHGVCHLRTPRLALRSFDAAMATHPAVWRYWFPPKGFCEPYQNDPWAEGHAGADRMLFNDFACGVWPWCWCCCTAYTRTHACGLNWKWLTLEHSYWITLETSLAERIMWATFRWKVELIKTTAVPEHTATSRKVWQELLCLSTPMLFWALPTWSLDKKKLWRW